MSAGEDPEAGQKREKVPGRGTRNPVSAGQKRDRKGKGTRKRDGESCVCRGEPEAGQKNGIRIRRAGRRKAGG